MLIDSMQVKISSRYHMQVIRSVHMQVKFIVNVTSTTSLSVIHC